MASIKLLLNKDQIHKDRTFPLVFQIIHRRKKKLIYTPYRIFADEFDTVNHKVCYVSDTRRSFREIRSINRNLGKQYRNIQSHIDALERRQTDYTVGDILSHYKIEHNPLSLLHYMDTQIRLKQNMGKDGTAAAYRSTRSSVATFIGQRQVTLNQLDTTFLRGYEQFLHRRGVTDNTVCFYMRNLKSMFHQAVLDGLRPTEENPFKLLRVKPRETVKRAIDRNTIRRMAELELSHKPHLELARDLYLFSFFSRGMSFVDIVFLKRSRQEIDYYRKKTKQRLRIGLTPQLSALINKYDNNTEYVFPILNPNSPKPLYKQYRLALERVNRNLKQVGRMLGIETKLTTYVARHSWATQARRSGAPMAVISEGLGHTSEETTRIYLQKFDQSILDKVNEQLSEL